MQTSLCTRLNNNRLSASLEDQGFHLARRPGKPHSTNPLFAQPATNNSYSTHASRSAFGQVVSRPVSLRSYFLDLDFLTLALAAGPPKRGVPKPLAPASGEGVRVPKRPPGAGATAAPKGVAAPPNPDVPAKQGTRGWVATSLLGTRGAFRTYLQGFLPRNAPAPIPAPQPGRNKAVAEHQHTTQHTSSKVKVDAQANLSGSSKACTR